MLNLLVRYRHISLFVVLLLISISLLSFNRPLDTLIKPSNMLERGVLVILQPFQNVVSGIIAHVQDIWQKYIALIHLSKENQRLHAEIKQLQVEKNRYVERALAYERLKGTLHLIEDRQFSTILARVIGYDPTNHANTVIVNRGTDHGVKESWPVITQDGIVGVTVNVSKKSSKVLLLIDPNCNVASLVQRTRDQGIVGGQTKKDAYIMKYVNRRANIREGTIFQITTQALDEIAKEDIPGFKVDEQVFNKLQEDNVPIDILTILEGLKDHQYPNQKGFTAALENALGKEQADWYKRIIFQYAKTGILAKLRDLTNQIYETEEECIRALEDLIGKEPTEKYASTILKHVQEEETVVSSGLGGIFPKGLIVGTVSKVIKQNYGLFQEIEVAPSVDFSKLEEVLIIRREGTDVTQ